MPLPPATTPATSATPQRCGKSRPRRGQNPPAESHRRGTRCSPTDGEIAPWCGPHRGAITPLPGRSLRPTLPHSCKLRQGFSRQASLLWTHLLAKEANPERDPNADHDQRQQRGIHEGQDGSSGYGYGSGRVKPHSQDQYSGQRDQNARSQAPSLAFRCAFAAA